MNEEGGSSRGGRGLWAAPAIQGAPQSPPGQAEGLGSIAGLLTPASPRASARLCPRELGARQQESVRVSTACRIPEVFLLAAASSSSA